MTEFTKVSSNDDSTQNIDKNYCADNIQVSNGSDTIQVMKKVTKAQQSVPSQETLEISEFTHKQIDLSGSHELLIDDTISKDQFGVSRSLMQEISKKYKFIEFIGQGSYGCVSKGLCIKTGKFVALKILEKQCNTEYDLIKVLREIQILKKLGDLCKKLLGQDQTWLNNNKNQHIPSLFTPELIDIICLPDS